MNESIPPSTTLNGPGDLDQLVEELSANITSGGKSLRECLVRLDQVVRSRFRKDALQQLVARIGSAAAARENALGLFLGALNHLPASVTPETAIRGLLVRKTPPAGDELLHDLIVWCLVPDEGGRDGGRKAQPPEPFVFSTSLLRELKRGLGDQFPLLGTRVWDRAVERRRSPCWCEAWARMCLDILRHAGAAGNRRTHLAEQYVERICQVDAEGAGSVVGLLLFLKVEMGPLGAPVASRVRQAPVGRELARQVGDLVAQPVAVPAPAADGPRTAVSEPDAASVSSGTQPTAAVPAEAGFEGLPEEVEASVKSLIQSLRTLFQAQQASTDELPLLRQQRQQLQEEVEQLRTALRRLEDGQRELRADLDRARDERDSERRGRQELEQAHAALRAASERQEKELRTAREDYERLAHRSDQDLGQVRQHVLDALHMDLRETCELMARMLEKVLQGQREPRHLASVWNQLDEILWGRLGTSGYPVDEPPA
jgi:hypothetical protein